MESANSALPYHPPPITLQQDFTKLLKIVQWQHEKISEMEQTVMQLKDEQTKNAALSAQVAELQTVVRQLTESLLDGDSNRQKRDELNAEIDKECPVCLIDYCDQKMPKALECGHAMCHDCVVLPVFMKNGFVNCPYCTKLTFVPGNDVNQLPNKVFDR